MDWETQADRIIHQHRRRPIISWTARSLINSLGLPYTPRNSRYARKALEALWKRGVLVRRREAHVSRAAPSSPAGREIAYSLPHLVLKTKTTSNPVYQPNKGRALIDEDSLPWQT